MASSLVLSTALMIDFNVILSDVVNNCEEMGREHAEFAGEISPLP